MALLTREEAQEEAGRRFGFGTSRYVSFMASWDGLEAKGRFGREKYRMEFGRGRRAQKEHNHDYN